MRPRKTLISLIGNTPLIRLPMESIFSDLDWDGVQVFGKFEMFNPYGSIKDRTAWGMIESAQRKGLLRPGMRIVEPTSGNTGIGLAWISKICGYRCSIVMPENVSDERKALLKILGAEVVLTSASQGMKGTIKKAKEIIEIDKNAIMLDQFSNPANPDIHYRTTAVEIWQDLGGEINGFIAGIGTGGTITGVGRFLKERNKSIKVIGVEPDRFPHKIQGIGAGFEPPVLDKSVIDEIIKVSDEEVLSLVERLAQKTGIFVGPSSCAALLGLYSYCLKSKKISGKWVIILPDRGERYLSDF